MHYIAIQQGEMWLYYVFVKSIKYEYKNLGSPHTLLSKLLTNADQCINFEWPNGYGVHYNFSNLIMNRT